MDETELGETALSSEQQVVRVLTRQVEPACIQPKPEVEHPPSNLSSVLAQLRITPLWLRHLRCRIPRSVPAERPERIEEAAEAEARDAHQRRELHNHGAQGEHHEVVAQRCPGQSG